MTPDLYRAIVLQVQTSSIPVKEAEKRRWRHSIRYLKAMVWAELPLRREVEGAAGSEPFLAG